MDGESLQIILRSEAMAQGLTHYFTGIPCHKGHISRRYLLSKQCMTCSLEAAQKKRLDKGDFLRSQRREWAAKNPEKIAQYSKDYYEKNHATVIERMRAWAAKNRSIKRAASRTWAANNKERVAERNRLFVENNKEKIAAYKAKHRQEKPWLRTAAHAKRRSAKLKATPSWANLAAIKEIYRQARALGMHVDHIVPLQGEFVCGLHVEGNLQLLPPAENIKKKNKFDVI